MALARPSRGWFAENRVWLALLAPLVVLALLASSWNWWTIWKPNHPSSPQRPVAGEVHLSAPLRLSGHELPFDMRLRADKAERAVQGLGQRAVDGLVLYRVAVTYATAPEQPLTSCQITLLDQQGASYQPGVGTEPIEGQKRQMLARSCDNADAPGPNYNPLTGAVEQPFDGGPRPAQWSVDYYFALPKGRQPSELRVVYQLPDYAALPVS